MTRNPRKNMLLQQQVVSRKTPLDGKLEISPDVAVRLAALANDFPLASAGRAGSARLQSLQCACGKRAEGPHEHYFLESPLLRELAPGTEVRLELDESAGGVRIEPV